MVHKINSRGKTNGKRLICPCCKSESTGGEYPEYFCQICGDNPSLEIKK